MKHSETNNFQLGHTMSDRVVGQQTTEIRSTSFATWRNNVAVDETDGVTPKGAGGYPTLSRRWREQLTCRHEEGDGSD